jgi:Na+/glutamate symporter
VSVHRVGSDGWLDASLALGPSPEVGVVLQAMALGGAIGALAAARSFRRTGDADRRWLITTRWATVGLVVGVLVVLSHLTVGVP